MVTRFRPQHFDASLGISRRASLVGAVVITASWFALSSAPAFAQSFSFTGAEQTYVVPSGVTSVHVVVVGAPGGQITGCFAGGFGAGVTADLPIQSGQTSLFVEVGGTSNVAASSVTAGAFNGGGAGGGGGASDVRLISRAQSASIGTRVLVAGGGGAACDHAGDNAGAPGGGGSDGKGGTALAGGAGGPADDRVIGGCRSQADGSPGSLGQGGAAGQSLDPYPTPSNSYWGGGGGGYYGGGGGGGFCGTNNTTFFGSGGGGSSYVTSQAQHATIGLDATRTPEVTITPLTSAGPPAIPAADLSALRVEPGTFRLTGRRVGGHCGNLTHGNRKDRRCQRPIALKISYQLIASTTVTFAIEKTVPGRRVRSRCVDPTHRNRHKHRCTRQVALPGTLSQTAAAGPNNLSLDRKISGWNLVAGTYELSATPTATGGNGQPQTASFRITR